MPKITILSVNASVAPKGYEVVDVGYKTEDGKTKGMKILGFGSQKELIPVIKNAKRGDVYDAGFGQNDKGFWQFTSLSPSSAPSAPVASAPAARGNWETSEERANRQVLIVRQSSLSSAVAFHAAAEPKGITVPKETIVDTAKAFEAYVFDKPQVTGEVE